MIQLIQEIRDRGDLSLILSSHLLRDVEECCDQVLILKNGNVAAFCNLEEERRVEPAVPGDRDARRRERQLPGGHRAARVRNRDRRAGPHQAGDAGRARSAAAVRDRRPADRADPPAESQARFARRHLPQSHGDAPMAVYKKTYRPYDGELTAAVAAAGRDAAIRLRRPEPVALPDHLLPGELHLSAGLRAGDLRAPQRQRAGACSGSRRAPRNFIPINAFFFMSLLGWQSMLALFLAAFIGPGLVSPDLANNALSLYLSRPFSRSRVRDRQDGGAADPALAMTWIPGLLLLRAARRTSKAGRG